MNPKLVLIGGVVIGGIVLSIPFIYSGMKKNDYDTLAQGIQNAKRRGGVWIEEDFKKRKVSSYAERYVKGDY
ncbi:MAG TPA: hypothetical protein PKA63_05200 [Oligoflexia bacterium]|nr:hypothetical protein [Oligoflexia bacterium]HMP48044.1 hypothetical protein [Oligoflexia bacterium]